MTRTNIYIWQQPDWPHFTWDSTAFSQSLAMVNMLRGKLLGRISMFGLEAQSESVLNSVSEEIIHSAQIEGEILNCDSVRSSVAKQLGLKYEGLPTADHYVEGVVQVMVDAITQYAAPLSDQRLFAWHAALFPMGRSGLYKIDVGQWRRGEEPMQVVSGVMGHETVHYEAPPSDDVPYMMQDFLTWVNASQSIDPVVKAAIAHLWFVSIHPFDDGNGRICRTITELLLSQADQTSQRYYSLSTEILTHRKDYYVQLERAQHGGADVTQWISWFLHTLQQALQTALLKTENVVRKVKFWQEHRLTPINNRQRKVINMLFDGFEGKLTSSKWYKINHCSQDTATRDINDLIKKGILQPAAEGGRSTSYTLVE